MKLLSTIVLMLIVSLLALQSTLAYALDSENNCSRSVRIEVSIADGYIYIKILNANKTSLELVGANETVRQYPLYTGLNVTVYRIPLAPGFFSNAIVRVGSYTLDIDLHSIMEFLELSYTVKKMAGGEAVNATPQAALKIASESKVENNTGFTAEIIRSTKQATTIPTTTTATICSAASKATAKQPMPQTTMEEKSKTEYASVFRNIIPIVIGVLVGFLAYVFITRYY